MPLSNLEAETLVREGVEALQQGRASDARARFETITASGRANAQVWLLLAMACRAGNDPAGEETALDRLLALEPRLLRAHIMKGDCRATAGNDPAALGFYTSALLIARNEPLPDDLAADIRRVEGAVAEIKARFEAQREGSLTAQGLPAKHRSPRFQQSLDILSGRKQVFLQEPTGYYFPGLPQVQFFDPAEFAWVPAVEAATGAIRDELSSLLTPGAEAFRPYIVGNPNSPRLDDNPLLDSKDWSALFLCENGNISDDIIARCPRTWQALQPAPLPRIANSPTVMFSLLRAGARINAHTGTHNTRLVCHLPLIVPPNCRFRVGNDIREWEEGRLMIFDDTIEHEAWNDSNQDRVVLIFDIWRPELTEQERLEVGALFAGQAEVPAH